MNDYEKEKWVRLYESAMVELEQALMVGRLVDARAEIVRRVEKLRDMPGLHTKERQGIDDALRNLRVLEQEIVRNAVEEQRRVAESALQKLRLLKPTLQRLESSQSPD